MDPFDVVVICIERVGDLSELKKRLYERKTTRKRHRRSFVCLVDSTPRTGITSTRPDRVGIWVVRVVDRRRSCEWKRRFSASEI